MTDSARHSERLAGLMGPIAVVVLASAGWRQVDADPTPVAAALVVSVVLLALAGVWTVAIVRVTRGHRRAERRFASAFHSSPTGMVISELEDGKILEVNDGFLAMSGYQTGQVVGRTVVEFGYWVDPEARDAMRRQIERDGAVRDLEMQFRHASGQIRTGRVSAQMIEFGGHRRLLSVVEDISERKAAEAELEKSLSMLRSTLESTADGILVVDRAGRISTFNRRFVEIWGLPEAILASGDDDRALAFVIDQLEDPDGFVKKVRELYDDEEAESFDVLHFKDGRVFERFSQPHRVGDRCVGRVWSFRDATERFENEARQQLMINELDHRVKNMLATVQAISEETLETSPSPAVFVDRFRERTRSLGRVHEALAQRRWSGANLRDLVEQLVAPYHGRGSAGRVEIGGDDVLLPVASVLPVSMAIHELATNAAKYGALSVPEGVIEVKWRPTDDAAQVQLQWLERGGPEVTEPAERGFGIRFIEHGIEYEIGGRVDVRFDPAGLECDMTIPLRDGGGDRT